MCTKSKSTEAILWRHSECLCSYILSLSALICSHFVIHSCSLHFLEIENMYFITGVIVFVTFLNIFVHYLRERYEEEDGDCAERKNFSTSFLSDHHCRRFSLAEIKSATQDFDEALIIGKGGSGKVYIGIIENINTVAIKRFDSESKQGAPEFRTEIEMLSKLRHSHLVSLIGYCNDHLEMIIVYEYMPGGSLEDNLHKIGIKSAKSSRDVSPILSWVQRIKICLGAARGLDYLHTGTGTQQRVIHRDVKSSNILLDENMEAQISDFGLSKIGPRNKPCTHVSTNVKGTFGYLDPEYFMTRRLTRKSDVYAFGVVLFEVLSGRGAVDIRLYEEQWGLAGWARDCVKEEKIDLLVDPCLRGSISSECLDIFSQIANQCLEGFSKRRPTMAEVVSKLELALELQEKANSCGTESEIVSTRGTCDSQDGMNSESGNDMSNPCTEKEVVDAHNEGHNGGPIIEISKWASTSHVKSHDKTVKKMSFAKKVRLFFSPKSYSISEREVPDGSKCLEFDFGNITTATDNFAGANKLGQGGFGPVYKGWLGNGQIIAVKILSVDSRQGEEEFKNEIKIMGKVRHENLLQLIGFSKKEKTLLLIYEFVQNGSLDHFLFDSQKRTHLDWGGRCKIIGGVAQGLLYLHENSPVPIIHRDIKPSNILIDADLNPKISDFGLASLQMQGVSECITDRIVGTLRYMAPEYIKNGRFSVKSDVFSYGILVLEIINGQKLTSFEVGDGRTDFLADAWRNWKDGTSLTLVDHTLTVGPNDEAEVVRLIQIGLLCVQENMVDRPSMGSVVHMLSSLSTILSEPSKPAFVIPRARSPSLNCSGSGEYSITDLYPR